MAKKLNLKEGEHFKYNQQTNNIKFFNDSEIILKDLFSYPSDPDFDSLGSLEIAGAFIDEANQVSEKAKNIVMSRMRHKLDEYNISPKMFMSCNPNKGWIYNEFYKKSKDNKLETHKAFIQALSTDNPYITKHYVSNLEKLDTVSKNRLLHGQWEYEDALAIFDYDSILEMFDKPVITEGKNFDYFLSIDVARLGKDKTCILVWRDFEVIDMIELSKLTLDKQGDIVKELKKKYNVVNERICIDTDGVGGGLADQFSGCVHIINNQKPFDNENYQNLKTQLYFKLASMVNNNEILVNNLTDDAQLRLTQELQILKRDKVDQDGKVRMTPKESVKHQIGRSPDISDALAYRMIFIYKSKVWDYKISFGTIW